ncbi:MAG TPA: beta-galactosidase GalB [Steroidobacteraceae bacterium]|nr:beta-galactosidase GalB [Steroidobacteraceae bacterium]
MRTIRSLVLLIAIGLLPLAAAAAAADPQVLLLWPNGAPGSEGKTGAETVRLYENREHIVSNVHRPSITVYLPPQGTASGAGVVVIPGGGHAELWTDHEGHNVARFLADHGVAAFVLKYRLARQPGSTYTVEGTELADAQRALRVVRSHASEWQLDPQRIGVMGFSAGGELAALAGTLFNPGTPAAADPIERLSSRPSFQALFYPSIHGTLNVSSETPPAYLVCGADDRPEFSEQLAQHFVALRRAGVSAEMHILAGVGHGFGLRPTNQGAAADWPQPFLGWLDGQGMLKAAMLSATAGAAEHLPMPPRRIAFNDGWRFFLGDAPGAEQPGFSDARWSDVRLPHDWAIAGPFDAAINPHTGGLPISGTGWYRKTFTLPPGDGKRYTTIEFDGAMSNAHVWLNGQELGGRPYGYIGFAFDLTPQLRTDGRPNVLAVRLAPEPNASRWYPGAGIYRNVWLDTTGPVHVARWGTYVTTPAVTATSATVAVKTEVRNRSSDAAQVVVRSSIVDGAGKNVAQVESPAVVSGSGTETVSSSLTLRGPQRWDVDHPYLYSLVTEIVASGTVVDRYTTPFGVRTIAFDHKKGFLLNGRALKLHGVCLHHDLGALGAAVSRRATERQLEILKAAGVNAIRTSHNPPSPELLEFADRLGLLVMDEAFDMWRIPKVPNGYSKFYDEWSERDLRDMVHRDRNHPSIILWSIGNEIPEQGQPDGWKEAKRLTAFYHEDDPTRPTTSAFNNWEEAIRNKLADEVDIPGFNYKPNRYREIMKARPDWIIYGSETASCVSSRGTYHLPLEKYQKHSSLQISSYDIIAPSWAYCPDLEFEAQDALPALLGEFVWTGFDYIGEPTPFFGWKEDNTHDWPARSSYFGLVDLAGFPKDRYYLYQSVWTTKPMVHVLPHWNWAGREGQSIPVMAYSNGAEVELFLNGKSLGRKKTRAEPVDLPVGPNQNVSATPTFKSKYRLEWQVPYAPGTLTAIAYKGGKEIARDEFRTAGAPARIELIADRKLIRADGDDLSFITVRIEDKDGKFCPLADNLVHFRVAGAGEIAAVDNGNAATIESFQAPYRQAFNGLALLIVRSTAGRGGAIDIVATAEGLSAGNLAIQSEEK